tara:strand:+ start:376 stop:1113 length:738 start_codon:yes stop_codon:yes gene_type:complete
MNDNYSDMNLWDHVEELRWRLIKSILAIGIGSIITYLYSDWLMYVLILPTKSILVNLHLQVLKVTSMFMIKLSIALFGGVVLGFPIIVYQIWRFISPAFENRHGFVVFFSLLFSSIFSFFGMSFAYFIIIPFSLSFFTSINSEIVDVAYNFTLEGYILYILWIIFGCGILFQLPIISTLFTRIGILTPAFLREYRKFSIIIFFIIAAILTPPDPLSQVLIVLPLLLLYEFSILISILFTPSNVKV